jgi:hypothetical protein
MLPPHAEKARLRHKRMLTVEAMMEGLFLITVSPHEGSIGHTISGRMEISST